MVFIDTFAGGRREDHGSSHKQEIDELHLSFGRTRRRFQIDVLLMRWEDVVAGFATIELYR